MNGEKKWEKEMRFWEYIQRVKNSSQYSEKDQKISDLEFLKRILQSVKKD